MDIKSGNDRHITTQTSPHSPLKSASNKETRSGSIETLYLNVVRGVINPQTGQLEAVGLAHNIGLQTMRRLRGSSFYSLSREEFRQMLIAIAEEDLAPGQAMFLPGYEVTAENEIGLELRRTIDPHEKHKLSARSAKERLFKRSRTGQHT